jgi:carboxymethylenebutenolidase
MILPETSLKDLYCPVLYHQAGRDRWVPPQDIERLRALATEYQKSVEIRTYPEAPHAFSNEMRPDSYRADAAADAWIATASFLKTCFHGI